MESVDKNEILKSLLLSIAVCLCVYRLWIYRHLYRFALKFPGHLGPPFIGVLTRVSSLKDIILELNVLFLKCKSYTICIWIGLYPMVVTANPDIVEKILSSTELLNKSRQMYSGLDILLDNGIITSRVEKWHKLRKLINPTFNHKVLLSFIPVFNKGKNLALKKLDDLVGRGEHKITNMFFRISLGISVETTMGKVMNVGDQVEENITKEFYTLLENTIVMTVLSFIKADRIFRFYKRYNDAKLYWINFISELIKQRIYGSQDDTKEESLEQPVDDKVEPVISIKKTPLIFIDQMFKMYKKNECTWQDIANESNNIVAASFETTGVTIFSILLMLAMHPQVQEKLYEELLDVFPDKEFEFEFEHMDQLPYLDRVINETLRVCPSVPLLGRHVERDTQLTKDILLPQGLQLMISIFHLHRRTEIWGPDADKFDPDHFLPENMAGKHPYAFIPFSKGSRNCIGWRYAIFSIKTIISGIVRNFHFTTSFKYEDLEFVEGISLKYHQEPGLEIHRR